ncbi:MAG TPA: transcriptional regulator [Candidatus Thermoplasmatota archaeon]|nr:transcriptional regulator [Candidatus Thermoplasmatota archaeon]
MTGPTPADFDPVLHSGPRITILSRLVIHHSMGFAALQKSTTLTAGNLSTHLDVLAKAGFVALDVDEKKVVRRKTVRITPGGDAAFRAYVKQVRAILEGLNDEFSGPSSNHPAPG